MSVVFAHDHNFIYSSGKYYSNGSFGLRALERYTKVFENLTILSRQEIKEKVNEKFTLSSGKNINFVKIPDLNSFKNIQEYNDALKIIESQIKKTDYVIARLPSTIGNLAVKYAKKNNIPYLIELVGCPWDTFRTHSIKGKIIAPFMYLITRKLVQEANYVLYVTNNFLQDRYPSNGNTINCSNVTLNGFNNSTLEKRSKKISNLSKNEKKIIGTTAALDVRYKGQQFVIKALGELKKRGITNFEYQLVGSGDSSYLLSLAEQYNVLDQIKVIGSLPNKNVFKWLDKIDIYVQPSETEGLPRSLIEAMSRALPAIGARVGGIPELLDPDYIYNNNQDRIHNICNILLSFDKNNMKEQSRKNYEESQKYDKNIIEERRTSFFTKFKNENLNKKIFSKTDYEQQES